MLQQVLQRALHRLHGIDARRQFVHVLLRDVFDLRAGAIAVAPQVHEFGNLGHREAQIARALDETQRVHVGLGVLTVATVGAVHLPQQTERFIVAQHLGGYTRKRGGGADVGGRGKPCAACCHRDGYR